jgi:putative ABC transport system permease protein
MIKNYFKIAWRNISKRPLISLINIAGLTISIAFCLLLIIYILMENSFDKFHQNRNSLFRVEMTNVFPSSDSLKPKSWLSFLTSNDEIDNSLSFPLTIGPNLIASIPDLEDYTRFQDQGDQLVQVGNEKYREQHILYADQNFFKTFSFKLLHGAPQSVFSAANQVVISKSTAIKYFGDVDPIGKTISLVSDSSKLFSISGIAEDAPVNSSIQYNLIIPITSDPDYQTSLREGFNRASYFLILKTKPNISTDKIQLSLNKWMSTNYLEYIKSLNIVDSKKYHWYLRKFEDSHFNISANWGHYTDRKELFELASIALIILIVASLNYTILAISSGTERALEVSVRKVLGANRKNVVTQFWSEAQLIILISMFAALLIAVFLIPIFNQMLSTQIRINDFKFIDIIISFLVISLLLGLFAGLYPAWLLSKMNPALILKGFKTYKINLSFTRILLILQYSLCVILMILAATFSLQLKFINKKDLGFNKDLILIIKNQTMDPIQTNLIRERLLAFSQSEPSIVEYSGMNGGLDGNNNLSGFKINDEQKWRKQLSVDYDYFNLLNIPVIKGRVFSKQFVSDSSTEVKRVVVNEELFKMLGKTAAIGQYNKPLNAIIIGVVKNYNFESLSNKIDPEEHLLISDFETNFMLKLKGNNVQNTLDKIQTNWRSITNNYPFEFSFLDETIQKMYDNNLRWQKILQVSSFFSLFIACLGLFGFSSLNASYRIKEIAIRRTLGGSVYSIVLSISLNIVISIVIALFIAIPIGYLFATNWLQNYAFHATIGFWNILAIIMISFGIGVTATIIKAIAAAHKNPAKVLKTQ